MTGKMKIAASMALFCAFLFRFQAGSLEACSTFKLQKGNELLYGHNLNQPGMNVPGIIFINKRGLYKIGRSGSEMLTKESANPSALSWISRYGSVTFSTFGRDMPDGGINEAGLYIWEMSDDTEYPKNGALPKLIQMNWMQYILDSFSTTEEAVAAASDIEIDGWGWHYFVGDGRGRCASIEFIKGRVVIHQGDEMPVPALFNESYAREMEIAGYFRGFGGLYPPDLNDKTVPRFVKTAAMIRDYDPSQNAVEYGKRMLDAIKVNEVSDWSVLVDVRRGNIYFKNAWNPEWKSFSLDGLDFSNAAPVLVLNMDQKQAGDVSPLFHAGTEKEIREFLAALPLPESFFTSGGIAKADFVERFASHNRAAEDPARQLFAGLWKTKPEEGKALSNNPGISIRLETVGAAVGGKADNGRGEVYALDHIRLVQNSLSFTFRNRNGAVYIGKALIDKDRMDFELWGIENFAGRLTLYRNK